MTLAANGSPSSMTAGPHFERYGIVDQSPAIDDVIRRIELVSATRSTVLITGAKRGKFALADRGSIFLAEIGTMSGGLQAKLLRVLQEYHWPGNVRELENTIERAVVLTTGSRITRHAETVQGT